MARTVELGVDTVTLPTESMRRAMAAAELGDDVWDEDPTIHRLQERAAEMVGKEASLFVPSGTMGNLCALITHTEPGEEVLVEGESHIFHSEVAGGPPVRGRQPRPPPPPPRPLAPPQRPRALPRPPPPHPHPPPPLPPHTPQPPPRP